jgi:endonuclease YncB( thermonuclease family)
MASGYHGPIMRRNRPCCQPAGRVPGPVPGVVLALAVLLAPCAAGPALADAAGPARAVAGPARILTGDTLEVAGEQVRLAGIDAPEPGQVCHTRRKRNPYDCGQASARRLAELIGGSAVACVDAPRAGAASDAGGPRVATCTVDGVDLAAQMVVSGWALADPETGGGYARAERAAEVSREGLWRGTFVPPWDWRAGRR